MPHTLDWKKLHDPTKANQKVWLDTANFGDSLRNADGFQQSLLFAMYCEHSAMGISWLTQATCEMAFHPCYLIASGMA